MKAELLSHKIRERIGQLSRVYGVEDQISGIEDIDVRRDDGINHSITFFQEGGEFVGVNINKRHETVENGIRTVRASSSTLDVLSGVPLYVNESIEIFDGSGSRRLMSGVDFSIMISQGEIKVGGIAREPKVKILRQNSFAYSTSGNRSKEGSGDTIVLSNKCVYNEDGEPQIGEIEVHSVKGEQRIELLAVDNTDILAETINGTGKYDNESDIWVDGIGKIRIRGQIEFDSIGEMFQRVSMNMTGKEALRRLYSFPKLDVQNLIETFPFSDIGDISDINLNMN
jgi:hypothetical protein